MLNTSVYGKTQGPIRPSQVPLENQVNNCGTQGKDLARFIQQRCPELYFNYNPTKNECVVLNPSSQLSVSDLQMKLVGSDLSGYEPFVKRT